MAWRKHREFATRPRMCALDARTKMGVVLGYAAESHSYLVHVEGTVKPYRSIYRLPLSKRWSAERLQEVHVTVKDMHVPHGARVVPFEERKEEASEPTRHGRAPRKLELRQGDFDPSMGGHGWTEHCPKCTRAREYSWEQAANSQHSDACRTRIEVELAQTERGRARLAHSQQRSDMWLESSVAAGVEDARAEGEIQPASAADDAADAPPKFTPLPRDQAEEPSRPAPLLQPSRPDPPADPGGEGGSTFYRVTNHEELKSQEEFAAVVHDTGGAI